MAGSAILAFCYFYLFLQDRKRCLKIWAVSWAVYFTRYAFMLAFLLWREHPFLLIGNQVSTLVSGVLLLYGSYLFIDKKFPRSFVYLSLLGVVWILISTLQNFPFLFMSLPTFSFLAFIYIWTGYIFLTHYSHGQKEAKIVGWTFIIWGIHKADYPFLRPVVWLAPWGYLFGALLEFATALGLILVYFRQAKNELTDHRSRLLESQDRFTLAMEASQDGLFDWNLITDDIYYSPGWKRLLGYEDQEIDNAFSEWERLTRPSHVQESKAMLNEVITGQRDRFENEFQMRHKNGHWVDILARANVIFDENGRSVRVVGTHVDITARKASERILKESEKKHRSIIETALDGFWLTDRQGNLLEVNATYCQMSGYSEEELTALHIFDLDCLKSPDEVKRRMENIILQREDRFESRHRRKDGTVFDVEISAQYRPEQDGQFIFFLRDITEQKQVESERRKLQAQLHQAQKMESVGRLAGGVAHDFNNMLGVILGHVEFALEKAEQDHELHGDLKEIQAAAQRSAGITKQLLAFARKQTISPIKLDLNFTVESMLNMLRRLIGEDVDLLWKPAAHIWPVKMDPNQIDQILANLCINARDAIDGGGKLTIETGRKTFDDDYCSGNPFSTPGDFVLLAVSDNGCGMDKETLDNLFEPFFSTKEMGKGTGLGLATVYGIVKQNHGFINVYSEPGRGSTFKIYLPRLTDGAETDMAVHEKKAAAGGTETILLVEDEPSILRMTRMMLEKKGYTVLSADTPAKALKIAKDHPESIDLLMTDVVMPEMNGRDLAGQITGLYPDIRLLFMSGYTANVIAHQGVLDDGVAFIQKPFSTNDLAGKVRDIFDH